jgi:hypothetical protein
MQIGSDRSFALSNEFATVHVRRVDTGTGTRLEINSPRLQRSIQLDSIALESLTWQTKETFSELLNDPDRPSHPRDEELVDRVVVSDAQTPEEIERGERVPTQAGSDTPTGFVLSNEFATVHVRRVDTGTGTRLEINSPRLQHGVQLDPIALESLTWQTPDTFSRFLETPFGPDDHEV